MNDTKHEARLATIGRAHQERRAWTLLLAAILILSVVNLAISLRLAAQIKAIEVLPEQKPPLPCAAIPMKLVLEDPECADKLLRAMNVTNVRVLARGSAVSGMAAVMKGWGWNSSGRVGR